MRRRRDLTPGRGAGAAGVRRRRHPCRAADAHLTPIPRPGVTDPGGVAAAIAGTVVPGGERLLPAYLPAGMSATVRAASRYYVVTYTDDRHTCEISLSVNAGANPPPATAPGRSSTTIQFRGRRAAYVVYDVTAPLSQRYVSWPHEKGIVTGPPGPEYVLVSTGLTEDEFFRVANSLQAA